MKIAKIFDDRVSITAALERQMRNDPGFLKSVLNSFDWKPVAYEDERTVYEAQLNRKVQLQVPVGRSSNSKLFFYS